VHEELKRMKRVVFRSLEDRYRYGNTQERDIRDFVYLDILNEAEEESAHVEKIALYIEETMRKFKEDREVRRLIVKREQEFTWDKVWPRKSG
jgi:hypothetical protein